jgi:putative inorganic carbon (hco3(-)) transporter
MRGGGHAAAMRWGSLSALGHLAVVPRVVALLGIAAAAGTAYAFAAYGLDPGVPPIAASVGLALVLGLWRLEYGLALLILLTPFAENVSITEPGEARIRVALVAWAALLAGAQTIRVLMSGERLEAPRLLCPALLFAAVALVGVPLAEEEAEAASKFMLLAGSVAIYLLISMFLTEWRRLWPVLVALVVVGLAVGLHATYQYAVGDVSRVGFVSDTGTVEYRITSFFPHPNQLAGFLAPLVPLSLGVLVVARSSLLRAACLAAAVLGVMVVVFSYSRGALVALVALPLVFARDRRAWPVIAAVLAAITLLSPDVWRDRVAEVASLDRPELATRLDFWEASLTMFGQSPVTGIGLNGFSDAYLGLEQPGRTYLGGGILEPPETAHSLYLNTLAEQGLIGVAALLLLLGAFFALCVRLRRSADPRTRTMGLALAGAGVVLVVHNVFDVTFLDPKTSTLAWSLLGVAAALDQIDRRRAGTGRPVW